MLFVLLFLCTKLFGFDLTDREQALVSHVRESIEKAQKGESKLDDKILKIEGMSSAKNRHLLNRLCSWPNTRYLEIGCWKGSTWISALYKNEAAVSSAIAIDNWAEFDGPQEAFEKNCRKFLGSFPYRFYSIDCFDFDLSHFTHPVNLYFYDGNHSALSQELAFTYFDPILDDLFIAVVDDWNWDEVQRGTRAAFQKLNYQILFQTALPAKKEGADRLNWWNGLYVAVIRKDIH
jgi:hypothetical protein